MATPFLSFRFLLLCCLAYAELKVNFVEGFAVLWADARLKVCLRELKSKSLTEDRYGSLAVRLRDIRTDCQTFEHIYYASSG